MPNWKKVIISGSDAHLNTVTASAILIDGSGSTLFDVQGSQGQLFSVVDSLSGSLFSVNNISGLPILEVFSNNVVKIGKFNAEAIIVSGSVADITGSLYGTASWAENAVTASYVATASYVPTLQEVTDAGNTTTNDVVVTGSIQQSGSDSYFLGDVRIGTTTPSGKLHVVADNGSYMRLQNNTFEVNKDDTTYLNIDIASSTATFQTSDYIILGDDEGQNNETRLTIDSPNSKFTFQNGNVGIGTSTPSQALTINGSISASGAIYDNSGSAGTSGQMIQSTGTGFIWTDNIAESARDLIISGKNITGTTIEKGTPLHFTASGVSGNVVGVQPADAGDPTTMPAGGVAAEQLTAGAEGDVYIYGFINGVDTSTFNSGDSVYVAVGGGYTNVKPTGSALIQKLGNVEKVDASNGSGVIQGPSWYNDLPNWEEGKIMVGRSDAQPTTSSFIHLDEASSSLSITGSVSITSGSLTVFKSGSTVFDIQGSQGQLFSITDQLSGSLFSVNDISGIPILEVFSDDTVKLGTYNDEAIIVSGSAVEISGSLTIPGLPSGSGQGILVIDTGSGDIKYDTTLSLTGPQGNQGNQGVQGPQGRQGFQGVQGPQGNQGRQGLKGDQGDQGPIGPQGNQGNQGRQGPIGPQGNQGNQGVQGPQGNQGLKGDQGDQGPQGDVGPQGNQGNQGFQGVQGPQGNQGLKGDQGDQGPQGDVGPQGNQGNQGIQGPQGNQGLKGDQGDQGPQGDVGPQGNQGRQGFQGVQGPQGRQGLKGDQGDQGPQGDVGPQGNQGNQGVQGPQGNQGLKGDQGDQGPIGPQGNQGRQGFQGPIGPQGNQGFQGIQGPQGNQGLKGDQGDQGPIGPQGNQGNQGNQGLKGDQGDQGPIGPQGNQGNQGFQGVQGPQGNQGRQGFQGVQGPQGNQGAQGNQGPSISLTGVTDFTTKFDSTTTVTTGSIKDEGASGDTNIYISSSGNIGINTSTPTNTLHVAGTTRLSGSYDTATSGSILTIEGSGSAQPIFKVQGSVGELFAITDSLSGSLFSVNDITGLPILEVFSDNTINLGNYQAPALFTTAEVITDNSGSFTVYSIPTSSYDGAFYEYTLKSGSNARAGNIMAIWSGTQVNFTETTTTDFGDTSGVSLGVFISGSNMVLTGSFDATDWHLKTIVKSI